LFDLAVIMPHSCLAELGEMHFDRLQDAVRTCNRVHLHPCMYRLPAENRNITRALDGSIASPVTLNDSSRSIMQPL